VGATKQLGSNHSEGCCLGTDVSFLSWFASPATARALGGRRRTEEQERPERKYGRGVENSDDRYEEEGNAEDQKAQESVWTDSAWLL
jgi:hypothetical protein